MPSLRVLLPLAALVFTACSTAPPPPKQAPERKPAVKPADETHLFPQKDLVDSKVVSDPLLGFKFLPGGSIASYKSGKREWRAFIVKAASGERAAIWLLDLRNALKNAKFVAAYGGYYGAMDDGTPVFAFVKGSRLAGLAGLGEKDFDPPARDLAAHLPNQ
jgi:hypothetical protein